MQRVVHASLHGNAYAIEEQGYEALRAYLERAAASLAGDPDRDEIVADLEQAIGEKCARHLGPHKTVVTTAEMARVLEEMGPVGAPGAVGPQPASPPPPPPPPGPAPQAEPPPRRLYRILEGAFLGGLCNGLGAYLQVDANVVRAVFVVLALLTHGAFGLVYLVLLFVIPAAGTSEERAAARGLPFSAQALVDEAKKRATQLGDELKGPWRAAVSDMKREWDEAWRRDWHGSWSPPPAASSPAPAGQDGYRQQLAAGAVLPLLALVSAALAVAALIAMASLVTSGTILGWAVPVLPLWIQLVAVAVVASAVGAPFQHARRALRRGPRGREGLLAAWDALLWLGFFAAFAWLAWHLSPELRDLAGDLPGAVEKVKGSWRVPR